MLEFICYAYSLWLNNDLHIDVLKCCHLLLLLCMSLFCFMIVTLVDFYCLLFVLMIVRCVYYCYEL